MIALSQLKDETWYDGFVWKSGKQQRVATMKWDAEYKEFDENFRTPHNSMGMFDGSNGFEPNVVSEEPKEV